MKESKPSLFIIFFQENIKDLKNKWKEIKEIISLSSYLDYPFTRVLPRFFQGSMEDVYSTHQNI